MKPYPTYKASNIEWLGDIPKHWEVSKLKYVANCFPSNIDKHSKDNEEKVRLCNYTDVYKNDFITNDMKLMIATAKPAQIQKFSLLKNDVIITKDSETADDIANPALVIEDLENIVCGYHLSVLRPYENLHGGYLLRLLQTKVINSQFEVYSNGVTRVALGVYDTKKAKIPIPTFDEQSKIFEFTLEKTKKIDRFIQKKQQLIQLLQEQKAAIINQAVTKGIQADVKMKPSGIEWLGEIPEHWEVKKLKYVANCFPSNVDKHSKEDEEQVKLCNYTDVYKNDFIVNEMNFMIATAKPEQIKKYTLLKNDVIITKDSETADDIANPALVIEDLENVICGYHLSVLRPYEKLYGGYLLRLLQTKIINSQFEVCSNGVTRVGLGVYDTQNAKIPIPPIEEQKEISSYIQTQTKKIQTAINQIEKEISLVQEYRTALIAEAVTGKIDVREYSPN